MSAFNTPDLLLTLPSSVLTFAASPGPTSHATRPTLKIFFTPNVRVPSKLVHAKANGKHIGECFTVIVPVGGKLQVRADIDRPSLDLLGIYEWRSRLRREAMECIFYQIEGLLTANTEILGIENVAPLLSNPNDADSQLWQLTPTCASAAQTEAIERLLTEGQPVAHLSSLDLRLQWVVPGVTRPRQSIATEDGDGAGDEPADHDGEAEKVAGSGDSMLFPDRTDGDATDGDSIIDDDDSFEPYTKVSDYHGGPVPAWAMEQLQVALPRLLKLHFLRRFPLIFDPTLLEYAACTAPALRSVASSFRHFSTISTSYNTPLAQQIQCAATTLQQHQSSASRLAVELAHLLPRRGKGARNFALPKPALDADEPTSQESSSATGSKKGKRRKLQGATMEDKVEQYMLDHVDKLGHLVGESSQNQGRSPAESRLRQQLEEVIGVISMTLWQELNDMIIPRSNPTAADVADTAELSSKSDDLRPLSQTHDQTIADRVHQDTPQSVSYWDTAADDDIIDDFDEHPQFSKPISVNAGTVNESHCHPIQGSCSEGYDDDDDDDDDFLLTFSDEEDGCTESVSDDTPHLPSTPPLPDESDPFQGLFETQLKVAAQSQPSYSDLDQ